MFLKEYSVWKWLRNPALKKGRFLAEHPVEADVENTQYNQSVSLQLIDYKLKITIDFSSNSLDLF